MHDDNRGRLLSSISGKPATVVLGSASPAMFGTTTLELYENRIVEITRRVIAKRDSEIPLTEIDSVDLWVTGNPIWLLLGILLLVAFGLGIIFIIVYCLSKQRFLVVHSKSNAVVISIGKGEETQYRQFIAAVLLAAERLKRCNQGQIL